MCRYDQYSISCSSSVSSNDSGPSSRYSPSNKPLHGNSKPVILNAFYTTLPILATRIIRALIRNRTRFFCLAVVLIQLYLCRLAYFRYTFLETVKFNRRTLSKGSPPPDAWWKGQKLTIFSVWIGNDASPPPVIQAAMQSCHDAHKDDDRLEYRVITNEDLRDSTKLGFELHPSFWLLDNVERSDYLRGELLHHHGGFYMDADMLCLRSFSAILLNGFIAGAAQDRTKYGEWPSVSQNAFGPFKPKSELTTAWHTSLMKAMDDITPALQECAAQYAPDPIPYPSSRKYGTSMCGTTWGQIIDFCKPIWWDYMKVREEFGHDMSMCNGDGVHLGWDNYKPLEKCDVVHLGTSGDFFLRKQWNMKDLCEGLPVMKGSIHCTSFPSQR
jgi:Capsular polysaccharide synthesis protein